MLSNKHMKNEVPRQIVKKNYMSLCASLVRTRFMCVTRIRQHRNKEGPVLMDVSLGPYVVVYNGTKSRRKLM